MIGWLVDGVQAHGVALTALGSCLDGCSVWRLLASARAAYSLFCSLRLHKQKRRKAAFPAAQAGTRTARDMLVTNHTDIDHQTCAERMVYLVSIIVTRFFFRILYPKYINSFELVDISFRKYYLKQLNCTSTVVFNFQLTRTFFNSKCDQDFR